MKIQVQNNDIIGYYKLAGLDCPNNNAKYIMLDNWFSEMIFTP